MERLLQNLKINVHEKLYVKDPESSDLGKRIVENSIILIGELGFEEFTFKKLGIHIGSNESSIYRYFENKHKLLLYLTSWYWGWMEYRLVFSTAALNDSKQKLQRALEVVTQVIQEDSNFSHINEVVLSKIIISEYSKSYLTKEVDAENKEGYFLIYKRLVTRLREIIHDVNPSYPYPASLASTVLEGTLHQHFLKEHFTSITDCDDTISPTDYFTHLVYNTLNLK
ncbi:TetR family transcriptional regulator [Dokdonia pacifica]|uniref:Transcriptional regulator, TetR family n=1 Tax=Dokdonia pacifica TaxID=1627892 RepID=A0A238ZDV2_9FLAO|nr:TetR/AcrR family transcriptional regulator [Dokdonia pacifica]GGG05876.1 TetR family transcriptional regulator [Dokdonia pacifica]SNR81537.1 transcriptional regulator, TetR family [Dokdonia pacifica]